MPASVLGLRQTAYRGRLLQPDAKRQHRQGAQRLKNEYLAYRIAVGYHQQLGNAAAHRLQRPGIYLQRHVQRVIGKGRHVHQHLVTELHGRGAQILLA